MSILGLGLLGYPCPLGWPEIKSVVGFVEIERCLADAVGTATGLRFGRGSLKLKNLGLLGVVFLDLPSKRAVRLVSREEARESAAEYAPEAANLHAAQTMAYRIMPDDELFDVQWVEVDLSPEEMPGARPPKVPCAKCGTLVRSGQVYHEPQGPLCAVCAGAAYFRILDGRDD